MSLNQREKEIRKLIADGMTYEKIGSKIFISPNTLRTHRINIRIKLEIKAFRDVVRYVDNFC